MCTYQCINMVKKIQPHSNIELSIQVKKELPFSYKIRAFVAKKNQYPSY